MRKAIEDIRRLFPNSEQEDVSVEHNEVDDTELFEDFSSPMTASGPG
jgi:hypothetical protein